LATKVFISFDAETLKTTDSDQQKIPFRSTKCVKLWFVYYECT